jgi:hypothetical protein
MKQALMLGALLLVGAACGDDSGSSLSGSMSQVYDLDFDSVNLVRQGDSITVEYVRASGATAGKTAKLVVNLARIAQVAGTAIDLTEVIDGLPRGTLQRVQQVTTDYPIQRGTIQFNQAPEPGAEVTGHFNTTLSKPAGRTLNGEFSGKVTTTP